MLGAVLAGSHITRGNSMRYKLGCSLSYEIGSAVTFIFNLEAARIANHSILSESLALTPPLERDVYTDAATSNRYFRVNVSPGMLALDYDANVELTAHHANPATINETPIKSNPPRHFAVPTA
jgi:hypothetical protein